MINKNNEINKGSSSNKTNKNCYDLKTLIFQRVKICLNSKISKFL